MAEQSKRSKSGRKSKKPAQTRYRQKNDGAKKAKRRSLPASHKRKSDEGRKKDEVNAKPFIMKSEEPKRRHYSPRILPHVSSEILVAAQEIPVIREELRAEALSTASHLTSTAAVCVGVLNAPTPNQRELDKQKYMETRDRVAAVERKNPANWAKS